MANIILNYQYHLTNVNWTNDYDNVLNFGSVAARNTHFDVATIFNNPNYNLINFNITNLYKTTVVIDSSDYITAMQSNYLIIKNKSKNEYYFYFITNCKQTNFNRVELTIELDVFQQYYYDVEFVDAPISRCKYPISPYNNTLSKYLLAATEIAHNVEDKNYNNFILRGIWAASTGTNKEGYFAQRTYGWMYVFVDPTHKFEFLDWDDDSVITEETYGYTTKPNKINGIFNNIGCLCFPIYSGSYKINIVATQGGDTYSFTLTDAATILEQLRSGNSGADAAYIYSVKISRRIPFSKYFIDNKIASISSSDIDMACEGIATNSNLYLIDSDANVPEVSALRIGQYYGLRIVNDSNQEYVYAFDTYVMTAGNPLTNTNAYDPIIKLRMAQYTKTYIDFGDGNKLEFDLTKASGASSDNYKDTHLFLAYKEAIVPDITRYSVSFTNATFYDNGNSSAPKYINETFTADMTLIFTLDQWSDFIANNKNFYAQGNFNTMMKINKDVASGAISAGNMNYLKAGTALINMVADTYQFAKNREFQIDNLKSAVDRVINQNGNACFNLNMHGIQPCVEYFTIPSSDQSLLRKELKMYGVNTNGLIDDIKNYDDATEGWHYCYIQAAVNELKSGSISLECEKALLNIFNKGVRLWLDPNKMYDFTY